MFRITGVFHAVVHCQDGGNSLVCLGKGKRGSAVGASLNTLLKKKCEIATETKPNTCQNTVYVTHMKTMEIHAHCCKRICSCEDPSESNL